MNLYLRLLLLWLATLGRPAEPRYMVSRLALRVWPNDLDLFAHVNNGRYLTLMDLGRLHIAMRSGLLKAMRKHRWHAAAEAIEIRFRRPLKLWQRYELVTEIVDWDEHWLLFEQRFESAGKVHARGLVKAQLRRGRERVPVAAVLELVGMQGEAAPGAGRLVAGLAGSVARDD